MTACRYTSCVLADSPASFMSSIIRVRIADIVCSLVIDGTTRLDADDSLTSYSSGDAATPPRLRHVAQPSVQHQFIQHSSDFRVHSRGLNKSVEALSPPVV